MCKNEIIACEERLLKAMKECDLNTLNELLHDDLIFNGPTGELVTKEMDLAAYRSGNMAVDENTISDQEIRVFGDTAIVTVTVHLIGSFMKQPIENKCRFVRTWKKMEGEWKMIGGASLIMPV